MDPKRQAFPCPLPPVPSSLIAYPYTPILVQALHTRELCDLDASEGEWHDGPAASITWCAWAVQYCAGEAKRTVLGGGRRDESRLGISETRYLDASSCGEVEQ